MFCISKLHWLVPSTIFGCLFLGLATAIGHHWLYQHMHGTVVGSEIEQKWVTRAGTALAFMFKMFIAIATGSAYTQQLWLTLSERAAKIEQIDGMFGALSDALGLVNVGLWDPWLTLTATVFWGIPIVAIITPGTIAIQSQYNIVTQKLPVPVLNYTVAAFCDSLTTEPSGEVRVTSFTSALQGSILQIQPQYLNSSYTSKMFMPNMKCTSLDGEKLKDFEQKQCDYFRSVHCPGPVNYTRPVLQYLSWMGENYDGQDDSAPFQAAAQNVINDTHFDGYTSLDRFFYVQQLNFTSGDLLGPDILVSCNWSNASYTIHSSFEDGKQEIRVLEKSFQELNDEIIEIESAWDPLQSYSAMLKAFDDILLGFITYRSADDGPFTEELISQGFLPSLTRSALTQIHYTQISPTKQIFQSSDEFGTKIEELFTNITLSYLSSPALVATNTSHAPVVDVALNLHQIVYTYSPKDLWRAYGLGLGAAMVCAVIAFRAMRLNKAAFRLSWSSVFRTTRAAELDSLLTDADEDLNGAHPVPDRIKQASLIYTSSGFRLHTAKSVDADYGSGASAGQKESQQRC